MLARTLGATGPPPWKALSRLFQVAARSSGKIFQLEPYALSSDFQNWKSCIEKMVSSSLDGK
jgi:hypothetical protein